MSCRWTRGDSLGQVNKILERSAEPIQSPYRQRIPIPCIIEGVSDLDLNPGRSALAPNLTWFETKRWQDSRVQFKAYLPSLIHCSAVPRPL